jgi:hypothetical protein
MIKRSIFLLVFLPVAGYAAENLAIFFLPIDPVVVMPRQQSLVNVVDVQVLDHREQTTIQVDRGTDEEYELALYPGIAAVVDEILTTAVDSILAKNGGVLSDNVVECRILQFDVSTTRTRRSTELIVSIDIALRIGDEDRIVSSTREQVFDDALDRTSFQIVIHQALADVANKASIVVADRLRTTSV